MSTLSHFALIPNLGTASVIEKLAESFKETAKNPQKKANSVTLYLKSGLGLRGHIVAVTEDTGPKTVVYLPEDAKDSDMGYILLSEVVAVVVHQAVALIEQLSDGRIAKPMATAPSMNELNRLAKTAIDEVNAASDGKMTLTIHEPAQKSAEVMNGLYLTLRDLYSILRKSVSEELGRQHLHERNFQFSIRLAEQAEVQVRDANFQILLGVDGEGVVRVSRDSIRSYLEEFM